MAAIGAALSEGVDIKDIQAALSDFVSVAGRFELIEEGQSFSVVVDYAHTPDGLEKILTTAKEIAKGRLITCFGCGGDRDKLKRPIMGRIAANYSDVVVITSDNPRTEDPTYSGASSSSACSRTAGKSTVSTPPSKSAWKATAASAPVTPSARR